MLFVARALGAGLIAAVASLSVAAAQDAPAYPTKTVRFTVGFAPGGGTDTVARIISNALSQVWGVPTVVENRAGAGGQVAANTVSEATPDGYTLLFDSAGFTLRPALEHGNVQDPTTKLTPISLVSSAPYVLYVNPKLPVQSVADLIKLAKEKPGGLSYASSGAGGSVHMATELFKSLAGVDITHVAYKGVMGVADVVAGRVDVAITGLQSLPLAQDGKLRALAVTSSTRSPKIPDVPTLAEAGVPGYDMTSWYGLFAPAGTPKFVLHSIEAAVGEALKRKDVLEQLAAQGMEPVGMPSGTFKPYVQAEYERWRKLVADAGITAE